MLRSLQNRRTLACSLTLAAAVIAGVTLVPLPGARAAEPAPRFQMPFPCGQTWQAHTHPGHAYRYAQIDMTQYPSGGKLVVASAAGTVTGSGVYGDGSSYVVIDHGGGWSTRYLHMQTASLIRTGRQVVAGTAVGRVGMVGADANHLHFEQRLGGVPQPVKFDGAAIRYVDYPQEVNLTSRNCGQSPSTCTATGRSVTDYRGRSLRTHSCGTYVDSGLYANVRSDQSGALDDSGFMNQADTVWVVCQYRGRANPVIDGNTNTWWLYTQGDDARANAHGYTGGWGYLPATAVKQGEQNAQIPGVPICPQHY